MSFSLIIKVKIDCERSFILAKFFTRTQENTTFFKPVHVDRSPMIFEELTIRNSLISFFDSANEEEADWYGKMVDPSIPINEKFKIDTPIGLIISDDDSMLEGHEVLLEVEDATISEDALPLIQAENPPSVLEEVNLAIPEETQPSEIIIPPTENISPPTEIIIPPTKNISPPTENIIMPIDYKNPPTENIITPKKKKSRKKRSKKKHIKTTNGDEKSIEDKNNNHEAKSIEFKGSEINLLNNSNKLLVKKDTKDTKFKEQELKPKSCPGKSNSCKKKRKNRNKKKKISKFISEPSILGNDYQKVYGSTKSYLSDWYLMIKKKNYGKVISFNGKNYATTEGLMKAITIEQKRLLSSNK